MSTVNKGTVDVRTATVEVAGTLYRLTPEQASYVNDDSSPCTVVVRSPEHHGGGSLPPVYKGTGVKMDRERKKVESRLRLEWGVQTFREMMLDKGIPEDLVDKLLAEYKTVRESTERDPRFTGKTLYKWTGGLVDKMTSVPNATVHMFIGVLTANMPQPTVQAIRDQIVHGKDPNGLYTERMCSVLEFAIYWTTPYAVRKISNFENERIGRVSGRTLHRSTDMGQQGRLFSESDISDLVNRTILMSFCPVLCRAVPVTDKGTGYLVLNRCTATREIGEHRMIRSGNRSTLCGREESLKRRFKKYQCTEEQLNAETDPVKRKKMITVQMYNDQMAELPSIYRQELKRKQKYSEHMVTRKGWWVTFTCLDTAQKFRVFTQSMSRAIRLCSYTGITAELEESVLDKPTVGLFGYGSEQTIMLRTDNISQYNPTGVYFKTLKFMMYTIYEYLFRRAVDIDAEGCLNVHRKTKMAKKNYLVDFSLHELWLQSEDGLMFTNEQRDIMDVELTLPENLPQAKAGYRRTAMYRDLVWRRTGYECTISRWDYEKLKERVFSELKSIWESDHYSAIPVAVPMTSGPGLFEKVEDRTVLVPPDVRAWGVPVYTDEIEVSALVKRTPEEIAELDKNPAVRKFTPFKTVKVSMPCWKSVSGDHLYIDQNHDDV